MNKALKITGITLISILGVIIISIVVICNIVFSPSTLTPIVRNNIGKFITCKADLDTVDLTFFSSFPRFSIHATNVNLVNPMAGAPSDTLAYIEDIWASVNLTAFLFHQEVILDQFSLTNAQANIFVDSTGNTNYNIIPLSGIEEEDTDTTSESLFDLLQLESIKIDGLSARYADRAMGLDAKISDFKGFISGILQGADAEIYTDMLIGNIEAHYNDSTRIDAATDQTRIEAAGTLRDNHFSGTVKVGLPSGTFALDGDTLANNLALSISAPAEYNFDIQHLALHHAQLSINEHEIYIDGPVQLKDQNDNINMDLTVSTNNWDIEKLITIIPRSYADVIDGISISGQAHLDAQVKGVYSGDTLTPSMPTVTARLLYTDGKVAYPEAIPYRFNSVTADVNANIDLNTGGISNATLTKLSAKTGTMSVNASGKANDLLGDLKCDINLLADINLSELKPLLPDDLKIDMKGRAKAKIDAAFALDNVTNLRLDKIRANCTADYTNLDIKYNDSIFATDPQGSIKLTLPISKTDRRSPDELLKASITATDLNLEMTDFLKTNIKQPNISVHISNPLDTTRIPTANIAFDINRLKGALDTITFDIDKPSGMASLSAAKHNAKIPVIKVEYANNTLNAAMGKMASVSTGIMKLKAVSRYDKNGENVFLQYNPSVFVDFNDGHIHYAEIPEIKIPAIKFEFRPNDINIEKSRIVIQNSDFNLSGTVTNLRRYMKKKGLLEGDLLFVSDNTNLDELMTIANGFGNDSTTTDDAEITAVAEHVPESTSDEPDPFIVPKGIDLKFTTHINHATFSEMSLDSIRGRLTVKDGIAVLEQMGFTTEAAEMQLTGMYRSERKNHLFAGLDFHLLNIDIHKLIKMIPSIDTIVPMLKSFEGKAEFHIAAETYLNAWYQPKLSTLRAAAAIEGKDLVLLDNETFSTIAKYMMFNKKTRNLVDSISVEMTVFRNEIDLYPFLVSMDKWQAVLSGRHNLDMSFNYHISLTDCPLPVRLGLDVTGTLDDLNFKLVPCKYKALYKPEKRGATEQRTLALKKLISDSLKANVKTE